MYPHSLALELGGHRVPNRWPSIECRCMTQGMQHMPHGCIWNQSSHPTPSVEAPTGSVYRMVVYDLPYSGIWVSTLYRIVSGNYHKKQDPNSNGFSMEISKPMTPIL